MNMPLPRATEYHVLLIGIDAYDDKSNTLDGCVNDINLMQQLLCGENAGDGVGFPRERIRLRRLAAPGAGTTSPAAPPNERPDRATLVAALEHLRGAVQPGDRVLIYYSGHGWERTWAEGGTWHEVLVPVDAAILYDVEINALIHALAACLDSTGQGTVDLTIILDCCHAAGAFRDELAPAAHERTWHDRAGQALQAKLGPPPEQRILDEAPGAPAPQAGAGMLERPRPPYLVLAACLPSEKALEKPTQGASHYDGVLTVALERVVRSVPPDQRADLRWAGVWPRLKAEMAQQAVEGKPQTPQVFGDLGRFVFGGLWRPYEPGIGVTCTAPGQYQLDAGTLLDLDTGAVVAVYSADRSSFYPPGTPDDEKSRIGQLQVVSATDTTAQATPVAGKDPGLHPGDTARARALALPTTGRLRVRLDLSAPQTVQDALSGAGLFTFAPAGAQDCDVWVAPGSDGAWVLGTRLTPQIATIPAGNTYALGVALAQYSRSQAALRLACNIQARGGSAALEVALLNANDAAKLQAVSDTENPDLPMVPRHAEGYGLHTGDKVCIKLTNSQPAAAGAGSLYVTAFMVQPFGRVILLGGGNVDVRPGSTVTLWDTSGQNRVPFTALPARRKRGAPREPLTTGHLVFIGTSDKQVDLTGLVVDDSVQDVVDVALRSARREEPPRGDEPLLAIWTAVVIPLTEGVPAVQ
jgi:hypothetical protein